MGLQSFEKVWNLQTELKDGLIQAKRSEEGRHNPPPHYLLLVEHKPVFTLGKTGTEDNLITPKNELGKQDIEYFKINRGGDITYHGPGQIVAYPILDLDRIFTDVHRYIRTLEEVIIRTIAEYGLKGTRFPGYTGVWLENENGAGGRKICAIGVHLSRWVSMHGLAFNVNTDLNYYDHIIPCGIADEGKSVTSMERELGKQIPMEEVKGKLCRHFRELFEIEFIP